MEYQFEFKPKAIQSMSELNIAEAEAIEVISVELKKQNCLTLDIDKNDTLMLCAKDKERKMLFLLHFKRGIFYVSDYRKEISSVILTIGEKTTLLINK